MEVTRKSVWLLVVAGSAACSSDVPSSDIAGSPLTPTSANSLSEGTATLTVGDLSFEYTVSTCQIRGDNVLVQAREGASGYAFQNDVTQTRVTFQREWESDGQKLQEQWDVRRPEYSVTGATVTASGTITRKGQWQVLESGIRERVQGAERIEKPFTLTATCRG